MTGLDRSARARTRPAVPLPQPPVAAGPERTEFQVVRRQEEQGDRFEVSSTYQLPDLTGLTPQGGRWTQSHVQLVDTYVDTASARLAQSSVTLRRQAAGPDPGWHLSAPDADARAEISDSSPTSSLPQELARLVVGVRAGEPVATVAQVTVTRTAHQLLDGADLPLIELIDDRVEGSTLGEVVRTSSWREITVEAGPGAPRRLHKTVRSRVLAAGARPSDSASHLQRTLGFPAHRRTVPDHRTVGGLAWAYLAEQCQEIVRCDIRLRLDEPVVHTFRVAIRRLRSTVRVFAPLFEAEAATQLQAELVWLAGLLGEVRDREVLLERLARQLAELPAEVVLGPVAAHIETTLLLECSEHQARLAEAMDGDRYQLLMRTLLRWQTRPPLTDQAAKPVANADRYLRRAEKKVTSRLAHADGDVAALHSARKAAKRYRYAAELAGQAGGKTSRILKSTTELQTLLGEHQDSVVSAEFLRRLGAQAGADEAQNGFTYGFLLAQEWQRAQRIRADAARRWGRKGA